MKKVSILLGVFCVCATLWWLRDRARSTASEGTTAQTPGAVSSGRPELRTAPPGRPFPRPGQESSLVSGGLDGGEPKLAMGGEELRAVPNPLPALGLRELPRASVVPLKLGTYAWVPELVAIPRSEFEASSGVTIVQTRGEFVFARLSSDASAPDQSRPVAMNLATKGLGVVTGVLAVKLHQVASADALVREYHLKPVQVFDAARAAFFDSGKSDVAELTRLLTALRADARVANAELEILEKWAVPK